MTVTKWKTLSKKYPNQWVALDEKSGRVVGAGKTPKIAFNQSQRKGIKVPLITKIPKEYGTYILVTVEL